MNFIQAQWDARTTNAWPGEIGIPIIVLLCSACVALFGWISVVPAFIASLCLVLLISYLILRHYMAPSDLSFLQFLRSHPTPEYSTYQMRSSQVYLSRVLSKDQMIYCLSFYILSSMFNLSITTAFIVSIYVTQIVYFIYDAVVSSVVYFWEPVISRSEDGISVSQPLRSNSPKVDQFQNVQDYEHTPFHSDIGFRLLLLKSGPEASPLEGELIAQSSQTVAIFTALSYTWENQPLDRYIICRGKKLAITANCEAALRQLRRRFLGRLLWVDAICIDQTNKDEKAQQIPIMDHIYGHATEVVVWLGERTIETEIGFKYLRLWDFVNRLHWIPDSLLNSLKELVVKKISDRGHQKCIFDIARRPWFRRVWTLQEITLARPHRAILYCGNIRTQYDFTIRPFTLLLSTLVVGSEIPFSGLTSFGALLTLRLKMRDALRFGFSGDSGEPLQPSRILGQIRAFKATDERDKIYALYALFRKIGVQLPQPSYNKTIGEVYRQATISTMNYEQSLDILLLVSGKRMKGAPSWVPDFSENISPAIYLNKHLAATRDSGAHFPISSNEVVFGVRGCVIDTVSIGVDAPPWKGPNLDVGNEDEAFLALKEGFKETVMGLQLWLYFCYGRSQSRYANEDAKFEACRDVLSRGILALIADDLAFDFWTIIISTPHRGGEEGPRQLDSWVEKGKRNNKLWWQFFDDPELKHLTEVDEWKILFAIKSANRLATVHRCVLEFSYGNKLFWTQTGYLGQGSAEMRKGDIIALIQGLRMPMILRPTPNDSHSNLYSVVSPAYISGIMKGELWEEKREQLEDFLLE